MIFLVILKYFLNNLFVFFFGKLYGRGVSFFLMGSLLSSYVLFFFLFLLLINFSNYSNFIDFFFSSIYFGDWIKLGVLEIIWSFNFDSFFCSMCFLVLTVSTCTIIYSFDYMFSEPFLNRFLLYLNLFTFFMLLLISSNNLLQLFIGWEGVGICSYLLINFWYSRLRAGKSSLLALFMNKVGDLFLLLAYSFLFFLYKSIDIFIIKNLFYCFYFINIYFLNNLNIITIFLILAAIVKSAQIGMHFWLPEAMEGPTPVSSLIHAATMVTAGIYLLAKFNFIYIFSDFIILIILGLGSFTCFLGSVLGIFQLDIKKIVAYSTCSQLGYMFFLVSYSGGVHSIFHLINHGFFKALLFLTCGYLIHSFSSEQDFRKFGGLVKIMPLSYVLLLFSSLSLMGIPFLSGFFSKENIINFFFNINILSLEYYSFTYLFQFLIVISSFFTTIYSIRLILYVFFFFFKGFKSVFSNIHFGSFAILIPLFLLFFFSLFSGYFLNDLFIGISTDFWGGSIFYKEELYFFINYLHSIILYNIFIIIFIFLIFFFFDFFFFFYFLSTFFFFLFYTLGLKLSLFYKLSLSKSFLKYSIVFFYIDKSILEGIGVYSIYYFFKRFSIYVNFLDSNLLYHYLGYFLYMFYFFFFIFIIQTGTFFFEFL